MRMESSTVPNTIPLQKVPELWGSFKPASNIESAAEESWKQKVKLLDEVSMQNNVVVFVLNPYTNRYLYMSDKLKVLSGIDPACYTAENGLDFSFSRAHPDHFNALVQINQFAASFFSSCNPAYYKTSALSANFLYKNGNGEYVQVLQRISVLELNDTGAPALFISFGHYVGHIKKAGYVDAVISSPAGIFIYNYNFAQKCLGEPKTFSEQEKKILDLLAQGDDTKGIAQKLFISPHTVDTHRRNLIKKTNCIDTTGVVAFAKLINLI